MNFSFRLIALVSVHLVGAICVAYACSCGPSAPCTSYAGADVVFVGEVMGSRHPRVFETTTSMVEGKVTKTRLEGGEIYFNVLEGFKGVDGRTQLSVHSTMGGGDCGAFFERGKRYLIFARKEGPVDASTDSFQRYMLESQKLKGESSRLWTSICSGNMEYSEAKDAIVYLRTPMKAGGRGTIEGRVFKYLKDESGRRSAKPYFGLRVRVVEADTRTEKAAGITDEKGSFRFLVPAGRYRIEPQLTEYLKIAGNTEDDTLEVSVEDSKCALRTLHITNNSLIAGFVLDETGKKVSGLSLDLITAGKTDGEPGFEREWSYASEDEGFTFDGIPPGEYQLILNYRDKPDDDAPYPTLFYPGTPDRSKATIFRIEEGTKLRQLEFKLPSKLRKMSLSGTVVWKDGKPAVGAEVQLIDLESDKGMFFKEPVTDKDGNFTAESFAERRYKIKVIVWQKSSDGSEFGIADAETAEFRLDTNTPALRIVLETVDPRRKSYSRSIVRAN